MKKVLSLALVIVMMMALGISAMAASVSISDPNNTGYLDSHTFSAWQIFSGEWAASGDTPGTLSDIQWGNGILHADYTNTEGSQQGFLNLLKTDAVFEGDFASCVTASDVAAVLVGYTDKSPKLARFVELAGYRIVDTAAVSLNVNGSTELDDGYWLVIDTTNVTGGNDIVKNASLLQVVGEDITITVKTDKPIVEKKVWEDTKVSDTTYGAGYNDVADHSIGDTVPFKIQSAVPDLSYYKQYTMKFHDTMDHGFTLNEDSIKVSIGTKVLTPGEEGVGDYHVTVKKLGTDADAELQGDTQITVHIYDLKKISDIAQGATIEITYTAVLNETAVIGHPGNVNKVHLEYSNNPQTEGLGKTPDDYVIVFTYGMDLTKVDGSNNAPLDGAEFLLKQKNGTEVSYAIVENAILKGWTTDKTKATTLVSHNGGTIIVKGLDDGTYYLQEAKAPTGYNSLATDVELVVKANTANGQNWDTTKSSDAFTNVDKDVNNQSDHVYTPETPDVDKDALVDLTVQNNKGTVLPETGGIGTVLFIAIGCTLILGASVVMVTRKKMSVYED